MQNDESVTLDEPAEEVEEVSPPEAPAEAATPEEPAVRRKTGELEALVGEIINDWITGTCTADKLTPSKIGSAIQAKHGLVAAPSTGAITNVLTRWAAIGYVTLGDGKPLRFEDYTEDARDLGLAALQRRHKTGNAPSPQPEPAVA